MKHCQILSLKSTHCAQIVGDSRIRGYLHVERDTHTHTHLYPCSFLLQIVGHMFAYPIVYDLVAETQEEKDQVAQLLDDVVGEDRPPVLWLVVTHVLTTSFRSAGYIKEHEYYLIDVTNRSTRWGVWNPGPINFNQSWSDEHGLNALEILSFLLSAYQVTGQGTYLTAWKVRLLRGTVTRRSGVQTSVGHV